MSIQKNALEWTVFAVAAAIVLASVGGLVYLTTQSGNASPDLEVRALAPQRTASGFMVPVEVRNNGDQTAEEVSVEVRLESDGQTLERSELTFAFVPRHSEREGAAMFSHDPSCCRVEARATSFEKP